MSSSTVASCGSAATGLSSAVPSTATHVQKSGEVTCRVARGSACRLRVFARSAVTEMRASCCSSSHRSEEHTSELQSRQYLVCRLLLEKKKNLYADRRRSGWS